MPATRSPTTRARSGARFTSSTKRPPTARRVFELIAEATGRPGPVGSLPSQLATALLRTPGLERFSHIPRTFLEQLATEVIYDARNTRELLTGTGIECPKAASYLTVMVDYVRSQQQKRALDKQQNAPAPGRGRGRPARVASLTEASRQRDQPAAPLLARDGHRADAEGGRADRRAAGRGRLPTASMRLSSSSRLSEIVTSRDREHALAALDPEARGAAAEVAGHGVEAEAHHVGDVERALGALEQLLGGLLAGLQE